MPSKEDMRKAVGIYNLPQGTIQQKNKFLMQEKGFSYTDCLEALNIASNGEVIEAILGG